MHINDGRAFLETTNTKYDLILFALPDSLALVNGASQIRLESFLFTEEAIQSAKNHLKPDGAFAMYNYYRDDWLIDRLAGTVQQAFGHVPCVDLLGGAQAVITTAVDPANQSCASAYKPSGEVIAPATDDRPFLYFKGGAIPAMYLWVLAGILLISLIAVRVFGGPFRTMRPYADLFFMGAAFLLLETKNVATFALLFGTTWLVNAMVFAGVLVIVLAAVETTRKFRTPPLPRGLRRSGAVLAARLDREARVDPGVAVLAAAVRRDRAGLPADLPGERGVLETVQGVRTTPRPPSRRICSAPSSVGVWSTRRC